MHRQRLTTKKYLAQTDNRVAVELTLVFSILVNWVGQLEKTSGLILFYFAQVKKVKILVALGKIKFV